MINDLDIVRICASTYNDSTKWDNLWEGAGSDNVYVGLKKLPGYDIVAFRGSITPLDWFRDFRAVLYQHPTLGGVELGFSEGIDEVYAKIVQFISQPTIVTGHSLGAARAFIFAGLLTAAARSPAGVVTFGSPRPGLLKLSQLLSTVTIRSYRNRMDPVPLVPLPLNSVMYMQPRELIKLNAGPSGADPLNILQDHHIELYEAGLQKLNIEDLKPFC